MTRLKYERCRRRHTQEYLATQAGLNQPALSQIERGVLIPTAEQLARLAAVYDIAPTDLLKEVVVVTEMPGEATA